jgi:hypothetical protein
MGFRNPLASAVDTGLPGGAGAKLYQYFDPATLTSYGVLEFRDGVAGDLPAQVVGKADYSQTGENVTVGGGLRLVGGKYRGIVAPELDLNVEPDGAGLYFPVARLKGAPTLDLGGAKLLPITAPTALPLNTFIQAYGSGNQPPVYSRDADGYVHLAGLLAVVGAASLAAGYKLATLPAGYRPTATRRFVAIGGNGRPWLCQINPTGDVLFASPAAADWSFTTGASNSFLSLDGIEFLPADML